MAKTDHPVASGGNEVGTRPTFPAAVYRETVLEPVFREAQETLLGPLIEVQYAHLVMLADQGIVPREAAAACLRALGELDVEELRAAPYDGSVEDLFFLVEAELAGLCGAEDAGRIHTARSRNDLDMTLYRMVLRSHLLAILEGAAQLRRVLVDLARTHAGALMPAYTHNQPAQPTTLGHYLMAAVEMLERDGERLQAAYRRVNRSPLGACAITTTGFPIDRELTAGLLGFDELQVNSYGAIAAVDHVAEAAGALSVAMLGLGRLAQDLLLWSTAEFGYLSLSESYLQISSIMPQKRNPVALEHVRVLASRALGESQAVLTSLHNTPFADMNDDEDPLQPLLWLAFGDGGRALRLLAGVLADADFDVARMEERSNRRLLTVTELADTLVRDAGLSFREAHGLVSEAVDELAGDDDPERLGAHVERRLVAAGLPLEDISVSEALDPQNFVERRAVVGGPAEAALLPEIDRAAERLGSDRDWARGRREALAAADKRRRDAAAELLGAAGARSGPGATAA